MPQVAARISDEQERWLKDYFRTKSAGAEFILPWAVDTFFRAITNTKAVFEPAELKTIVEAYKDVKVTPDSTSKSYLMLRVMGACDKNHANERFGASRSSLEAKRRSWFGPARTGYPATARRPHSTSTSANTDDLGSTSENVLLFPLWAEGFFVFAGVQKSGSSQLPGEFRVQSLSVRQGA